MSVAVSPFFVAWLLASLVVAKSESVAQAPLPPRSTAQMPVFAPPLPPRNICQDAPGHVQCFRYLDGLVHGGVITTPNFTVSCRAFRLVWMRRYKGTKKRDEMREAVVAGVCQQKDPSGRPMRTWSTAGALPTKYIEKQRYFGSPDAPLPESAIRQVHFEKGKKGRWAAIWFGYYFPNGWGGGHAGDNRSPQYAHWGDLGGNYIWEKGPAGPASIESPTFSANPVCSAGYVICSAYLKVKHPNPKTRLISVEMVGILRRQEQRGTGVSEYVRAAAPGWHHTTFE